MNENQMSQFAVKMLIDNSIAFDMVQREMYFQKSLEEVAQVRNVGQKGGKKPKYSEKEKRSRRIKRQWFEKKAGSRGFNDYGKPGWNKANREYNVDYFNKKYADWRDLDRYGYGYGDGDYCHEIDMDEDLTSMSLYAAISMATFSALNDVGMFESCLAWSEEEYRRSIVQQTEFAASRNAIKDAIFTAKSNRISNILEAALRVLDDERKEYLENNLSPADLRKMRDEDARNMMDAEERCRAIRLIKYHPANTIGSYLQS